MGRKKNVNSRRFGNIKAYDSYCQLRCTVIDGDVISPTVNNIKLYKNDFGEQYDTDPDSAEPYGCGNMKFIPYDYVKEETLSKYNITEQEYRKIQERLKEVLSFGKCGWCV